MYFWNSYPFVRLSIALIIGIVLYENFSELWKFQETTILILLVITCLSTVASHWLGFYKLRIFNGLFSLLIILYIGGFQTKSIYHSHTDTHYKNLAIKIDGFSGVIASPVNERTNHHRYDFQVNSVIGDSAQSSYGKIHLYIRKDSVSVVPLSYGDIIYVKGSVYPISGPDNPKEFNYKKYLERQNIFAHSFVEMADVKVVGNKPPNILFSFAYSIRSKAVEIIDNHIPEKRENAISKALLLGIKDFLDNDIKKAYASAGAMHVLAVSGLHVGIIYLIIQFLLGRLTDQGRLGKTIFGMLCVSLIWFYAIVTGLSPSVLRAATMFSAIALSKVLSKDSNIYNTLGIAAFILLLIDPYLIYSVGFQLSFAAVFGIVYLQPKLYRLLTFNSWIIDKSWAITCVSMSAQLATFPLSAYYFHQFPTYFLISNLVVIPSAFLLLILGVVMLIIDPFVSIIGSFLGRILYYLMWSMNEVISLVESLPLSLIEWIFLDRIGLFVVYAILITLICGLHFRSFRTLMASATLGFVLLFFNGYSHAKQSHERKLIFYEIKNTLAIDYVNGHNASLWIDHVSNEDLALLSFQIDPFRLSTHLPPIKDTFQTIDESFSSNGAFRQGIIGNQKVLIIDTTTFHLTFKDTIQSDILILNNGAIKSLKWLNDHFKYKHVIIGNKNSRYYSAKMKSEAKEIGIKIHSLKEDGALILPLDKKRADSLPALFTTNPD